MSELSRDLSDLAGGWQVLYTTFSVAADLALHQVAIANPLRWGLWLIVGGGSAAGCSFIPSDALISSGLPIPAVAGLHLAAGAHEELQYRAWGGLAQRQWSALSDGPGAATVGVIEVLVQQ